MKFKVGDRVKCINAIQSVNGELEKEKIYIVSQIDTSGYVELKGLSNYHYDPSRFKKIEYTYEDLKKSPIGTKVMFENGKILIKLSDKRYDNEVNWREESDLEKMKDIVGNFGKIVKIEEPTYTTVYEYKPEILNEVEKRYLRGVIRPFRDKVKFIALKSLCSSEAFVLIKLENDSTSLPVFEINTMYKGMKPDKEYTLEELGLQEEVMDLLIAILKAIAFVTTVLIIAGLIALLTIISPIASIVILLLILIVIATIMFYWGG